MTLSKMFVKCSIVEKKNLFISACTYSFYGLYYYDEIEIHESLEKAKDHLLSIRMNGHLSLNLAQ